MSEIKDVSDTAFWVAIYRADESKRPDALFKDPLAEVLAGEKGRAIARNMKGSQWTAFILVMRTVIIDRFIQKLVAEGADCVINLGAGLDTRPYRLDLPPTFRWIEVDYPHMIRFKEEKLQNEKPRFQLERCKMDLGDVKLRQEFFNKIGKEVKKAVILTEGVVPYLSEEEVASLLHDLAS